MWTTAISEALQIDSLLTKRVERTHTHTHTPTQANYSAQMLYPKCPPSAVSLPFPFSLVFFQLFFSPQDELDMSWVLYNIKLEFLALVSIGDPTYKNK